MGSAARWCCTVIMFAKIHSQELAVEEKMLRLTSNSRGAASGYVPVTYIVRDIARVSARSISRPCLPFIYIRTAIVGMMNVWSSMGGRRKVGTSLLVHCKTKTAFSSILGWATCSPSYSLLKHE